MRRVSFLTMDDIGEYVSDDELAVAPLKSFGWETETISWRDENTNWSGFDAVVIRTTWDYHKFPESFLDKLRVIDSQSHLENPLEIVEWNLRKTYLRELESSGVRTVPSIFGCGPVRESDLVAWQKEIGSAELVIKPVVSATAGNTFRFSELTEELALVFVGLEFIVQPLMKMILTEGEYSLFFFYGSFSHAIIKTPAKGDFRVQEDFGGLNKPIVAPTQLVEKGRKVIDLMDPMPLYARVDFVRDDSGEFALMELELIEPSLYFRMDKDSPERFARAFVKKMNEL